MGSSEPDLVLIFILPISFPTGIFFSLLFFDLGETRRQLVKESMQFIVETCQYPSGNYRTRFLPFS